jgi:hypothetical protein
MYSSCQLRINFILFLLPKNSPPRYFLIGKVVTTAWSTRPPGRPACWAHWHEGVARRSRQQRGSSWRKMTHFPADKRPWSSCQTFVVRWRNPVSSSTCHICGEIEDSCLLLYHFYLPKEKRTSICTFDLPCCLRQPCCLRPPYRLGPAQLNLYEPASTISMSDTSFVGSAKHHVRKDQCPAGTGAW